jgi:hypothetical protein
MTHYFLFGSRAVDHYVNQEFENISSSLFGLFVFTKDSNPVDFISAYDGWSNWCEITEEDYLKLEHL